MNTLEIWNALSSNIHTKKYFKGVFSLDRIPKFIKNKPALLVVNIDKSNKPGSHWVAIYLPLKGNAEYFDSYGIKPMHDEFIKFFKRQKFVKILYNKIQLQNYFSTVCGQYCCVFLLQRTKKKTLENFIKTYFNKQNFEVNDKIVETLFLKNFKRNIMHGGGSVENLNFKDKIMFSKNMKNQVQTCSAYIKGRKFYK